MVSQKWEVVFQGHLWMRAGGMSAAGLLVVVEKLSSMLSNFRIKIKKKHIHP